MDWFSRLRRAVSPADGVEEAQGGTPAARERASPGVAALFERMKGDGRHVILDLGAAAETHLRLFQPFSRRIRFAGWVPAPPRGSAWVSALEGLPPNPDQPYDTVLGWDVLNLLGPEERTALVARLAELTAPGAGLYFVVGGAEPTGFPSVRYTLTDLEHVSQEVLGPARVGAGGELLPAQVERLLEPSFQVVRGFTLRQGVREYLALKPGASASVRVPAS